MDSTNEGRLGESYLTRFIRRSPDHAFTHPYHVVPPNACAETWASSSRSIRLNRQSHVNASVTLRAPRFAVGNREQPLTRRSPLPPVRREGVFRYAGGLKDMRSAGRK
jgi:hypothetical protein